MRDKTSWDHSLKWWVYTQHYIQYLSLALSLAHAFNSHDACCCFQTTSHVNGKNYMVIHYGNKKRFNYLNTIFTHVKCGKKKLLCLQCKRNEIEKREIWIKKNLVYFTDCRHKQKSYVSHVLCGQLCAIIASCKWNWNRE